MNAPAHLSGYSARVCLRLEYAGHIIPLTQVAPAWIMPREPLDLPPGAGEVVVEVDGHEHRRPVRLPHGMSTTTARVTIQPQAPVV